MLARLFLICISLSMMLSCTNKSVALNKSVVLQNDWELLSFKLDDEGNKEYFFKPYIRGGEVQYPKHGETRPISINNEFIFKTQLNGDISKLFYRVVELNGLTFMLCWPKTVRFYYWCEKPSKKLLKERKLFESIVEIDGYRVGQTVDTHEMIDVSDLYPHALGYKSVISYVPKSNFNVMLRTVNGVVYEIGKTFKDNNQFEGWKSKLSSIIEKRPENYSVANGFSGKPYQWKPYALTTLYLGFLAHPDEVVKAIETRSTFEKDDQVKKAYLEHLNGLPDDTYKLEYKDNLICFMLNEYLLATEQ